jgi:hypothetical protein
MDDGERRGRASAEYKHRSSADYEHPFGPNLSQQEAIRRLTALSSTCRSCASSTSHDLDWLRGGPRKKAQSVSTLRHYSADGTGERGPSAPSPSLSQQSSGAVSVSAFFEVARSTSSSGSGSFSPPNSPPQNGGGFWSLFDKKPDASPPFPPFLKKDKMIVPPLWNDMHDPDDPL